MYFDTSGDARWRPTRQGSIIFSAFPHCGRCLDRLSSNRMSAFRNMPLEHHCCMVNLNQILASSSKWRLEEKAKRTNLFKFVCRASRMVRVEPLAARKKYRYRSCLFFHVQYTFTRRNFKYVDILNGCGSVPPTRRGAYSEARKRSAWSNLSHDTVNNCFYLTKNF